MSKHGGKPRPGSGRFVIDWIRQQYENGVSFRNLAELQGVIKRSLGTKYPPHLLRDWDREAHLELAKLPVAPVAITNPVPATGYERKSTPTYAERVLTRAYRRGDTFTRLVNDLHEARADAAQADAAPAEVDAVIQMEAVVALARALHSKTRAEAGI